MNNLKVTSKLILFVLMGMCFIGLVDLGSAALANTTLLNDNFEGTLANWTTDWALSTSQAVSPTHSVEASAGTNDLVSTGVDLSDATKFYISFRYYITSVDGKDNVNLYYYNGASYDFIDEIGDDAEGSWLTFSQEITDAQYFDNGFNIYIEGSSIDNNEYLWIDDFSIIKTSNVVNAPVIHNVSASHSTIKGGDTLTIYANTSANGINDSEQGTLYFYCDSGDAPTAANTDCTGGTTSDASYPYILSCTFTTPLTSASYTEYCRVYDGTSYSANVSTANYTTDSSAPSTSILNVAGDTEASYFDTVNDASTLINISGESGMSCRWSASDQAYSSMSNACAIDGTVASCNMTNSISQGFHTYYASCQDSLGNEQNSSNNLEYILQ